LVGPSGGGKSSIIKLLQRFYVPQTGTVLIDGRDVGDYDQKWLVCGSEALWLGPLVGGRGALGDG
jgi:subfamily B ATP-binding cassette protein HlyB/CyaB